MFTSVTIETIETKTKMKFLIVLSSLLVVAYGLPPEFLEEIKKHARELGAQCKTEIGATDDDISPIVQHLPPTTDKGKCFLACVNKKTGFQDADGKMNKAGALALFEKLKSVDEDYYNKAKQVAETCFEKVENHDDECDTAEAMYKCCLVEKQKVGLQQIDFD